MMNDSPDVVFYLLLQQLEINTTTMKNVKPHSCKNHSLFPKYDENYLILNGVCDPEFIYKSPRVFMGFHQEYAILNIPRQDTFSFIACGETEHSKISFQGFTSSFDIFIWILITAVLIIMSLILNFQRRYRRRSADLFELIIPGLKVFLEQTDLIASNSLRSNSMYFLCGPILLMGVVLTNLYKGDNITALTAPPLPVPLTNFKELLDNDYKIYTRIERLYLMVLNRNMEHIINSTVIRKEFDMVQFFMKNTRKKDIVLRNKLKDEVKLDVTEKELLETRNWDELLKQTATMRTLSSCNNVAIVGWSRDLEILNNQMVNLRSSNLLPQGRYVFKGSEVISKKAAGWLFENTWQDNPIFKRMQSFTEMGILKQWFDLEKFVQVIASRWKLSIQHSSTSELISPVRLNGNISVIFVLYGFFVLLCLLAFICECNIY